MWALVPTRSRNGFAKVGGIPDALGPVTWPVCETCRTPMRFLFQLPHDPQVLDLSPFAALHAFQCENPDSPCRRWDPDAGANVVLATIAAAPELRGAAQAPPAYEEVRLAWVAASEPRAALSIDVNVASSAERDALEGARAQAPASKLGGVPVWLQSPWNMECCGTPMRFIAQVSAEPFSLNFGDEGRAFVFRCASPDDGRFQLVVESG